MEELNNIIIINKIESKFIEIYSSNEISKKTLYEAKGFIDFHRNASYDIYNTFEDFLSRSTISIFGVLRDNISSYVTNPEECEILKAGIDAIAFITK